MIAWYLDRWAPGWLCGCVLALCPARALCQAAADAPFGGTLAVTSNYIYRGVSESDGQGALQADLHGSTAGGTFAGIWATTRDRDLEPGTWGETQLYLGQRLNLSTSWTATLGARADYFVGGTPRRSDDYQELSFTLTWLDQLSFSLTAIPAAVRYSTYEQRYHPYRSPAFVADASGQWLLLGGWLGGGLYATAGAGYYYSSRPDDHPAPAVDYLYGNAGLAFEWRRWRIDAGYFVAQSSAALVFPYPVANRRFAGTLSWQF